MKRGALPWAIAAAMALGIALGPFLGTHAVALGGLGTVTIQLIKGLATPLLFLAILRALATTDVQGRWLFRLLWVALANVSVAIGIGIGLSNWLGPGRGVRLAIASPATDYADKKLDLLETLTSYVPGDVVTPFTKNMVLSVVLLALLFGFALRRSLAAPEPGAAAARQLLLLVEAAYELLATVLGWVRGLIPLAVFGVVAKTVAAHGLGALLGLLPYVLVGLLGLALHVLVTYQLWLVLFVRLSLVRFWRAAQLPVLVAWGSNSSLATLPVTLEALDQLGVSRRASAVGACVGTNLNNDGIVLYEGMAVLFVAQALGLDLSLGTQLLVALVCIVAAMGVAGVPEAGFVSLAIVLNAVGLSVELLPVLLSVDWIVARGRSVVNVLSDMVLSLVLERLESGQRPGGPASA